MQPHLDAEEQSDKEDRDGEEEEEHEEPGTPMEPVAETHHPHVLLKMHKTEQRQDPKVVLLFAFFK